MVAYHGQKSTNHPGFTGTLVNKEVPIDPGRHDYRLCILTNPPYGFTRAYLLLSSSLDDQFTRAPGLFVMDRILLSPSWVTSKRHGTLKGVKMFNIRSICTIVVSYIQSA